MPSPKPKPIAIRKLEGNPSKRPLPEEIRGNDDMTKPPYWLSTLAKNKWRQLVPELKTMGLYQNIDYDTLALYCDAYARYRGAQKVVADKGTLYKTEKGNVITSPMLWVLNKAFEQMLKVETEFGMTPSSRVRLSASPKPVKDEMEQLLDYCRESTKNL